MPSSLTLYPVTAHLHRLTLGVPNLYNCLVQIALSRFLATLRQFTVSLPDNRYIQILIPFLPVPGPGSLTPVDPRGTVSVQMPCSDPSVSGSPWYYYRLTQSFVRYNSFLLILLPGPGSLTPVDPRGINLINYLVQIRLYLALRRHGFLPSSVGHLSPR